jgi:predicted flap endonuclease-1-like 5' DNA nuclease
MYTLIILLTQTKGVAIIEILFLLLVAAIIGYITSWLYHKSIYVKNMKAIEAEKDELKNQIRKLDTDHGNLDKSLHDKDIEIKNLKKEVHALKTVHPETFHGAEDEALVHIAQRKHLLDYNSFGTANEAEKDDLRMISGIGPFIEERLHALDIYTFRQISKFSARDISMINDAILYFSGRIERDEWVAQAGELVRDEKQRMEFLKRIKARKKRIYYDRIGIARKEEADDLTIISGIGGWIKEKLNVLDIYTFRQIANFNEEDVHTVTDAIEYFPGRIERDEWILQAQELVRIAGNKSELLARIRERKDRIYYDRLGTAKRFEANNLTLIYGIGLWIEERLNLLEIYTFDQISKLTPEDVETITDILEISPDRIDRDNWISQARELAKNQQQKKLA